MRVTRESSRQGTRESSRQGTRVARKSAGLVSAAASLIAVALISFAAPGPLGAAAPGVSPSDPGATCALAAGGADTARASALRDSAREILARGGSSHWGRVARLLERAAAVSDPCAVETVRSLRLAGRLHYAVGNLRSSKEALRKAARHALAAGRVAEAGHTLLDAAQVSLELGEPRAARETLERVELLVLSPEVSPRQRERVLARIDPEVATTALLNR